jgi:hypothetical protein
MKKKSIKEKSRYIFMDLAQKVIIPSQYNSAKSYTMAEKGKTVLNKKYDCTAKSQNIKQLQHLDHSFTNKSLNLIKVCSFVIKL